MIEEKSPTLLGRLLGKNPLWLFALRLAARLSNYTLLAFALVSLATLATPDLRTVGLLLLILLFCMVNLRALSLAALRGNPPARQRLRGWAHLLSAAVPLAYVVGVYFAGQFETLQLRQAVAVTAPPLLNWLAIEQTLQQRRDS